jgi:hypothetical protein
MEVPMNRVQRTRRAAFRAGMLGLALAFFSACVFDQGSYQGGGRSSQGAKTAQTATATATDTTTATAPTATDDSGLGGILDGG